MTPILAILIAIGLSALAFVWAVCKCAAIGDEAMRRWSQERK